MAMTHNLFISHGWSYEDSYYRILDYLDQISNNYEEFDYINHAEPEPDAPDLSYTDELKVEYTDQINKSDLVMILADQYRDPEPDEPNFKFWIDFAVEQARQNSKPVIGIRPWNETQTPVDISNAPDQWVDWNPEAIKKAIENNF